MTWEYENYMQPNDFITCIMPHKISYLYYILSLISATILLCNTDIDRIASINWLMLFREIVAVYSENHTKPI
jgi:hypothetical protein